MIGFVSIGFRCGPSGEDCGVHYLIPVRFSQRVPQAPLSALPVGKYALVFSLPRWRQGNLQLASVVSPLRAKPFFPLQESQGSGQGRAINPQ